ncbi:MAG: hypothetical protein CVU98_06795 [Firmicutes bacterium HGW-Firmicutes-3]|jgi:uncharacterized protein YjdB|nr:MAG: hypothetical protein CVU98_06795 [Firmicutes bacterium HGW-Firmicutes-3]
MRKYSFKSFVAGVLLILMVVAMVEPLSAAVYTGNELSEDYVDDSNEVLYHMLDSYNNGFMPMAAPSADSSDIKADIVFVIDSTGSMSSYISNVKNNIAQFAQYLSNKGITLRIGVIDYKDITYDGLDSTIIHKVNHSPWMNEVDFIETLTKIKAAGGGDLPETPIDALGYLADGTSMLWSSDAHKFAVVLTDASYKVNNRHGYTSLSDIAKELSNQKINTSVITGTYYNNTYLPLTSTTGGVIGNIRATDFSNVLQELADTVMGITNKAKKAIYVLPGYLGSQLYNSSNSDLLWIDKRISLDNNTLKEITGTTNYLKADVNGVNTKIKIDMSNDQYGVFDTYQELIEKLDKDFSIENGGEYDIHFFPYNWLGDLNDSAKDLQNHINKEGYEKVVFVTHSTGGLLASTYAAKSRENKLKVEKAILIAPPLFGTYAALEPIELGMTKEWKEKLDSAGFITRMISPILGIGLGATAQKVYSSIKGMTKNSPTSYQLLPSLEYLKLMPQIYASDFSGEPVLALDNYYSILNGSSNINSNLTNGNSRSHNYLRQTVLGGDIVKVLQEVDTTLIGSSYGFSTPAIGVYAKKLFGGTKYKDIIYKKDGDGTVLNISAAATKNVGDNVLKYKDFKNIDHTELVSKTEVLNYVSNEIRGITAMEAYLFSLEGPELGMSEMVKLNVNSDVWVDIKIVDNDSSVIASVIDGYPIGFDGDEFIYTPFNIEEKGTEAILYLPNSGYKVVISHGEAEGIPVNFTVDVATLNHDGYKTSSATYLANKTKAGGEIISLDMLTIIVDKLNIGSLTEDNHVIPEIYFDQWEIKTSKILSSIGATDMIELYGDDVVSGNMDASLLNWYSSDSSIVAVSNTGLVEAENYGVAYIYAMATDGSFKVLSCKVTVPLAATSISIEDFDMVVGEKLLIQPIFSPSNTTETSMSFLYDSSRGIIDINDSGVITALSPGTIDVIGIAPGGAENNFTVSVYRDGVVAVQEVSIEPNNITIDTNEEYMLTAMINPSDAFNQNVYWYADSSANVSIVRVENNTCIIKGVQPGISNITVVTEDGGYTARATITVKESVTWPRATLIYGQPLESAFFNGGSSSVAGTFSFIDSSIIPVAGSHTYKAIFLPEETGYNIIYGEIDVSVVYNYSGVLRPINNDGSSVFKVGSTVPVKFRLTDAYDDYVMDVVATISYIKLDEGVSESSEVIDLIETETDGKFFRYDSKDNQYIFNLSTKGFSEGTYILTIELNDGTRKEVSIGLR